MLLDPGVHVPFHVHSFHHRLHDPVNRPHALEVCLKVAQVDPIGHRVGEEGVGARLPGLLKALSHDGVRVVPVVRRNVEQVHLQPGVGEMSGNLGAHRPGAQHRGRPEGTVGGRGLQVEGAGVKGLGVHG